VQRFALLTTAFVLWLAGLVHALPAADNYNPDLDDWSPERYATIDDANYEVGFNIPTLHNMPGWRIETIFVAWRGDLGLIDLTYVSDKGALLTLSVNRRRTSPSFIKAKDEEEDMTEERVRFAGRYARLVTYKTSSVEIMTTSWQQNRRPLSATAFVYPGKDGPSLTKQQLLDALETVH
jgi:hypothetical protein